jgi:hypothetical protein
MGVPVVPATREAETEGLFNPGVWTILGNIARFNVLKTKQTSQKWRLVPEILATKETEITRPAQVKS